MDENQLRYLAKDDGLLYTKLEEETQSMLDAGITDPMMLFTGLCSFKLHEERRKEKKEREIRSKQRATRRRWIRAQTTADDVCSILYCILLLWCFLL